MLMGVTIRIVGLAGWEGGASPFDGQYLKVYEPTEPDPGGVYACRMEMTPDRAEAKVFPDIVTMHAYLGRSRGTRPDGKPDRPIYGLNLLVERVTDPGPPPS